MDGDPANHEASSVPAASAIYFDGASSRRRFVTLALKDQLELSEMAEVSALWPYAEIRRADGASGTLRLRCLTAPELARLEVRDAGLAAEIIARCTRLDDNAPGRHGVIAIIAWSIAATLSIVAVILYGIPLAADRLAPLVPQAFERRLGDVADRQFKALFGAKVCFEPSGQAAFTKLVNAVRQSASMDTSVEATVLASPIPNAFALPGGKVYVFNGLLAKAANPDEIAGILAHELGHLRHRDAMRNLIYHGGTSFLVGLLFGDVTGSGAVLFASRSLLTSAYSRDAEHNADSFAIDIMRRLGRSPKPMGQLLFRVTGKQGDNSLSILASHPLTEDRMARMNEADQTPSGPPLLTAEEWAALKAICTPGASLGSPAPKVH